mmetsp:Transcript_13952/g.23641  ORF Transcript_13952/g.23641 Transcript_13952/m.23641 type:complete len:85 (+) Transcript_13952:175-429(+)
MEETTSVSSTAQTASGKRKSFVSKAGVLLALLKARRAATRPLRDKQVTMAAEKAEKLSTKAEKPMKIISISTDLSEFDKATPIN